MTRRTTNLLKSTALALIAITGIAAAAPASASDWTSRHDTNLINRYIHGLSSYRHNGGYAHRGYGHHRGYRRHRGHHYGYGRRHRRGYGYGHHNYGYGYGHDYGHNTYGSYGHYGSNLHGFRTGYSVGYGIHGIDLEVFFRLGSAEFTDRAYRSLDSLGHALKHNRLSSYTFLISGHTDASGSDYTNQTLSEDRAKAVKDYLIEYFDIAADRLVAVGFGETRPRNPADPYAAENRRVTVSVIDNNVEAAIRGYRRW